MVEETHVLLDKRDAHLLRGLLDQAIVLTTQRRGNVLDARTSGTVDVVGEWELVKTYIVSLFFFILGLVLAGSLGRAKSELTKASLLQATSLSLPSHSALSSAENGRGTWSKLRS